MDRDTSQAMGEGEVCSEVLASPHGVASHWCHQKHAGKVSGKNKAWEREDRDA